MPYAHLFSSIGGHLESLIAGGGYPFLFLTVILEGLPLIGTAVPGHITIIAAGFLARMGILNLGWVLGLAFVASVLGDFMGFMLGRRYGLSLIARLRPFFFIRDSHIEKAQSLLHTHTGKAMFIGRFSPVTRALMPFLVGTSHTKTGKFWFFNIVSGASWVALSVLLGYAFGASYHAAAGIFGKVVVGTLIAAVLIVWGYRFVNVRFHIFRRYELFTLILNLLSLWGLAATVEELSDQTFRLGFDIWVNAQVAAIAPIGSFLAGIAHWVSVAGSTWVTGIFAGVIALVLAFRRRWRSAAIMLLSAASTVFVVGVMKEFFMSPRPVNALQTLSDPSFPSGHAAMAAAFFVSLAYILAPKIHSWVRRELFIVICVAAVIAVGLSRIALNVHWVSDVVAGWSLGIFLATASILLVRYVSVLAMKKKIE